MIPQERYYRNMMGAIGKTMLLFLLFLNLFGMLIAGLLLFLPDNTAGAVFGALIYGIGYGAVFLLPIPCFRAMTRRFGHGYASVRLQPRLPSCFPLILFSGIALIFAAAYVNDAMVGIWRGAFLTLGELSETSAPYEIVLRFFVLCLIPGFCEELLFRGTILTNCLPFGRNRAIFISALLFAIMHQNVEQIFYAFVAGIFLGFVYESTGNLWSCILLHIGNNFTSLLREVIFLRYGEAFVGSAEVQAILAGLYLIGAVSATVLIVRYASERHTFREGIFGTVHPASDSYAQVPVSADRAGRLFWTPSMICFFAFACLQMLILLVLEVGLGFFGG